MADEQTTSSSYYTEEESDTEHITWADEFHKEGPHHKLAKIPIMYIEDKFNLAGINTMVENIQRCYEVLLDKKEPKFIDQETTLYLLIHQRYIMTKPGMEDIFSKIIAKEYGECKRVLCNRAPMIPIGISNKPHIASVKSYCYNCNDVYEPKESLQLLDGCAFGSTFPHLLVLNYKTQLQEREYHQYIPRIYGFKIYEDE
ncbi:Casein kinase II beta 2 subunit [Spraguea lophii 42_110]|uniref:Casein kinase II subunit beta n=1 Tax=Spraguea lophii (strain 42_110) TaxID=1358809 RepID=S7WAK2_SPRLO|nr:Casein kinase II beta 2 subunit [Spraguea lophii 42_110]